MITAAKRRLSLISPSGGRARRSAFFVSKSNQRISSNFEPKARRHQGDYILVVIVFILLMLGLVVVYSISPALSVKLNVDQNHFMYRQMIYLAIGTLTLVVASNVPFRHWIKLQPYIIILATISCMALFVPGLGMNLAGARRWLDLGPVSFQPAELVKFALVFYLATFFTQRMKHDVLNDRDKTFVPFMIILGIVGFVVAILQKDLGTMITVLVLMLTMLYFSGISKKIITMVVMVIIGLGVLSIIIFPHRLSRVETFIKGSDHATDTSSYQINQALIAVGSGGLLGKGIGQSIQVYGYLPEAANDSIFAVLAEKFGFIGTTIVVIIFGILIWRMLKIVIMASNNYLRMLAAGFLGWVMAHVIVNISAILGLIPLTGITLPFLSLGGTSLIFIMASLGVVFNISRYTYHVLPANKEEQDAHTVGGGRLRRSRYASTSRS